MKKNCVFQTMLSKGVKNCAKIKRVFPHLCTYTNLREIKVKKITKATTDWLTCLI